MTDVSANTTTSPQPSASSGVESSPTQDLSPSLSTKPSFFKRRLIVDPGFQFLMLGYTLFVIFATASVGFLSSKLQDPLFLANFQLSESTAGVYTLVSNLAVFMFVFLIMVFLSNRIAGPLFRLRKEMKRVAEGGSPRALTFRKSDLFQAIAIQYNVLIEKRFK